LTMKTGRLVAAMAAILAAICVDPTWSAPAKVKGLAAPFAEKPVLLTSAGQSADVHMLNVAAGRVGLVCDVEPLVTAADIAANKYKTIVFAIGGSGKGLGAAGIDQDQELARCMAIVNKVKDKVSIIVVHIGGKPRRGALSDVFIKEITPYADYVIVVAGGDDDGLFAGIASKNNIPMDVIGSIIDSGPKLAAAFK
jgi:hypothetical protein